MVRRLFITFLFLFILLLISGISGCGKEGITEINSVTLKNYTFSVDVADNDQERAKGLMFVESMEDSNGMLFIYPDEAIRGFWMRNTLIPLDMIFADSNLMVIDINKNALPCGTGTCPVYYSKAPAQYILEINGGLSDAFNISLGDKVKISK